MSRLIEKYIRELFDEKKIPQKLREELWGYYFDKLSKAVDAGYSPKSEFYDKDLARALKYNIAQFCAFKETSFRNILRDLLTKDGSLVPWSKFKKEAYSVSGDYNHRWLETEYHQTVANANMAEKWKDFERNADLYPNLKFVSVNDNRVRPEHKALDGTIRPINDPFWNKYTPPLDWGCRCHVVQTDEEPTEIKGGLQLKIEFENNPATSGKIFADTAYLNNLNRKERKEAEEFVLKKERERLFNEYKKNPKYFDVELNENGGLKATHIEHNFDKRTGKFEKHIQNLFFKRGDLFTLENESSSIPGKKIDGFINDYSHDISVIFGNGDNTIKRALNHSREKKAQVAILYFNNKKDFDIEWLELGINKYNGQTKYRFKKIIYIIEDKIFNY